MATSVLPIRPFSICRHIAIFISSITKVNFSNACLSQTSILKAPASLVFCAVFERTTGKYGTCGIRYVHIEIDSAAQNVSLQAVSLNLGIVAIGAFDDKAVQRELFLLPEEVPILGCR
jgi:SagB-type dehydrogenase family enzyme